MSDQGVSAEPAVRRTAQTSGPVSRRSLCSLAANTTGDSLVHDTPPKAFLPASTKQRLCLPRHNSMATGLS